MSRDVHELWELNIPGFRPGHLLAIGETAAALPALLCGVAATGAIETREGARGVFRLVWDREGKVRQQQAHHTTQDEAPAEIRATKFLEPGQHTVLPAFKGKSRILTLALHALYFRKAL